MYKKYCPKDKVLNPKSNLCIKKGTQLHKSLVKDGTLSKNTLPVPGQQSNTIDNTIDNTSGQQSKKCQQNKVLNPKTNHCVVVGSATYKKLVKDGILSGEEMITTHKDYGKEVELPKSVTSAKKNTKKNTSTKQKTLIKLSPNVKKLFLNKIKTFINKKTNLIFPTSSVKSSICNNTGPLPKSTYVTTKKQINYFSVNYFPTNSLNAPSFFFPDMNKGIIRNHYDIQWNNFTQRYFEHKLKLDVDSKNKEFIDYEWLNECNAYIKKLDPLDKFRLYGYSFHGDRYVNEYLRGDLNSNELLKRMKNHLTTFKLVFNQLFAEYLDVYKKTDDFLKNVTTGGRINFYNICCHSIANLETEELMKLVQNYTKKLSKILKNAPPLKKAMTLFRGSTSNYFQTLDKNKPFIHKGYMSASVDYNVATSPSFINSYQGDTTCCLMVINVLPGTRLLPMTGLSQINDEKEFLMNTDSKVMIRKTEMLPKIPLSGICIPVINRDISVTYVYIG